VWTLNFAEPNSEDRLAIFAVSCCADNLLVRTKSPTRTNRMMLRVIVLSFGDCERNRRYGINTFYLLKVRDHRPFTCLTSELCFPVQENSCVVASVQAARAYLLKRLFLKQEIT
jgi:hypothetical protein